MKRVTLSQFLVGRQRELRRLTRNNPDRQQTPRLQRRQQDLQQQTQRMAQQLQRQSQQQNAGMRSYSSRASPRMQRAG